ncbi:hypothetical protein AC249_AIPGENE25763 [Exaiptasia diaphana]|nr:hypothetical protein AC249_AIPGENE25763 [Exaiptasia diaphana]
MWGRRGANLFDDARGIIRLGYICQYPNGYEGCKGDSPLKTTSSPLSITTGYKLKILFLFMTLVKNALRMSTAFPLKSAQFPL